MAANGPFGVDHPVLAVRDLDTAAERLAALGFVVTPRGRHPWGTHNRLALFDGALIELITIGDPDAVASGAHDDGRFGRPVADFLAHHGEGVVFTALHSTDIERDAAAATARGVDVTGHIDFRRPVTLPDGTRDEAVVRLALLWDAAHPRLSLFLCQQVKRGLVTVPAWMAHPNGAIGFSRVVYLDDDIGSAVTRARHVWGAPVGPGRFASAGGAVEIVDVEGFERRFGAPPSEALLARAPAIGAICVRVPDLERVAASLSDTPANARRIDDTLVVPAGYLADTVIVFER